MFFIQFAVIQDYNIITGLAFLMEINEEWQIGKHYCPGKSLNR